MAGRELVFSEAVREFWRTRQGQDEKQRLRGSSDQGARSAVTGGKQMDGFVRVIVAQLTQVGVRPDEIFTQTKLELPGFYRPSKEWDLVVVRRGELLAAIELKSQVGPSFGNNFNNRVEEALGVASDTWTAFREGAFGTSPSPWLGYLFLLEDCPRSLAPVGVQEPHFPVFPEFRDASYAKRYELFCRKLVRERQFSAACFLMASQDRADLPDNYSEPAPDLSAERFL
ncbi:MAG TPA: restriction endonuclease, partial [Firmicutes bacterium]|nr:restriction endonuclease [Bacillota bacterium]